MNTIKFSKKENKTTEQHNLQIANIVDSDIFGSHLKMYTPCNLNVFVTESCQNKCFFCINDKTNKNINIRSLSDEEYIIGLKKLFNELNCENFEITITGGEPTLDIHRFVKTIQICHEYSLRCRTVSTTGLNLMSLYNGKPLCQHMIENNFVHNINISRMHYDESRNNEIFDGRNLTNKDIERLALFFKLNNAEMRVSCNLIKGYIDNPDDILKFIDHYMDLGVETVMFRELEMCENVRLNNIVESMLRLFEYIETLHGMVYDVDVYSYKDLIVKHYKTLENINKEITYSLSYKNGFIKDSFIGNKLNIKLI